MARYRKIDPRVWNDAKFRDLSDNGKLVFFMLLTHPNMTALGAMRATLSGLAEELGWEPEDFRKAFQEVSAKGMAKHDQKACLIALPKFIKYNQPESPNVIKAWGSALDLLPECSLKDRVIVEARAFAEGLSEGFTKALPEAFAKSIANQEPEQEQEQEQNNSNGASANADTPPKKPRNDYPEEFEAIWQAYPKREGSNPKNKAYSAYKARLTEGVKPETMAAGVARYAEYIRQKGKAGTEFVMQGPRFFGTERAFENDWTVAEVNHAGGQPGFARRSKSDDDDEAMRRWLKEQGYSDDDGQGLEGSAVVEIGQRRSG